MYRTYYIYSPPGGELSKVMQASVHIHPEDEGKPSAGVWCRNLSLGPDFEGPQDNGHEARTAAAEFLSRAREEGCRIEKTAYPKGSMMSAA